MALDFDVLSRSKVSDFKCPVLHDKYVCTLEVTMYYVLLVQIA